MPGSLWVFPSWLVISKPAPPSGGSPSLQGSAIQCPQLPSLLSQEDPSRWEDSHGAVLRPLSCLRCLLLSSSVLL